MLERLCLALAAQASHAPAPLVLSAPVSRWDDGLPLGDGALGVLVWGEGRTLRFSLDRGDLWDERTPQTLQRKDWTYARMKELVAHGPQQELHELFDVPYDTVAYPTKLPGGRLELEFVEGCEVREFALDLRTAEALVELSPARVTARVDAHAGVLIVRVDSGQPVAKLVAPAAVKQLGYEPALVGGAATVQWFVQPATDSMSYAVACAEQRDPSGVTFTLSVERIVGEPQSADWMSERVARRLPQDARQQHAAWWSRHWSASSVRLPDAEVQRQYDLARYLYGAGSRVDQLGHGGAPIALQGLWTADSGGLPPWKGDYHNDLNTQTTYGAQLTMGHAQAGLCFLAHLDALTPRFERFARDFYGVPGLVVPGVMTLGGRAMGGWGQYSLSPTNTAWLAFLFDEHWRYTQDREFLARTAYPWCSRAGSALAALLEPADSGALRLPLSSSPEMFDNSQRSWLAPNSNYDQSLLRWLFGALARQAEELERKDDATRWRALLERLEPLDIDAATGALTIARSVPYAESHRHFSHALALHPLGLVSVEGGEAERKLVDATLDAILAHGTDWWTGYSFSWMACMLARAGRADAALAHLEIYLAFTGRNGFHLNGDQSGQGHSKFTYRPFTLEGNMLAAQAVHEMLLQSWGGVVRVFPATSARWQDVEFESLRAEGALRVSATRRAGRTTRVKLHAERGGRVRLRDPFGGAAFDALGAPVSRSGNDLFVELASGAGVELRRR
ncbi:MAG: hypothetical protein FJ298_14010 [Planctomycetes bacterium]|nr:hypothetical protein [Planctomycetota bacterium]